MTIWWYCMLFFLLVCHRTRKFQKDILKHQQMRKHRFGIIVQVDLEVGRKVRLPSKEILGNFVIQLLKFMARNRCAAITSQVSQRRCIFARRRRTEYGPEE